MKSSNRTFMELKQRTIVATGKPGTCSNRTFMELKWANGKTRNK